MKKVKGYLLICVLIFTFLLFITWQQITIFKLAYRVTYLKEAVKKSEIKNQFLLSKARQIGALNIIEEKAGKLFSMKVPDYNHRRILEVKASHFCKSKAEKKTFAYYIKQVFSPADAQAR